MFDDTIAAIATPVGSGGIGIIRISGPEALKIADTIFMSRKNKPLSLSDTFTMNHGHIMKDGEIVDEVLVSVMKSPHSFTREDVVEINCHGGMVAVKEVLETVLSAGARLAEAGEFSKRAFLNGRIDLAQAESIIDLINAKTSKGMKVAFNQLQGRLSKEINSTRDRIIEILAHIEAGIDFPEHDIEEISRQKIKEQSVEIIDNLEMLAKSANAGKVLREGLKTAIVGRPNVGKSSLLNALLRENRAIVTDIPGTTRDIIEEVVNVRDIPLRLIDTAGIRETEDIVEKIGVEKTREMFAEADLILLVLDASTPLTAEDLQILEHARDKEMIIIANKVDLDHQLDYSKIEALSHKSAIIQMSIKNDIGIQDLESTIEKKVYAGLSNSAEELFISNTRHQQALHQALLSMKSALESLEIGMPMDCISIDVKAAWDYLGEITGDTVSEDLVDQIFSRFCIGK